MSFHNQNREDRPVTAALACHPERSEGSSSMGTEMLRCAQHDIAALSMTFPVLGVKFHNRAATPIRMPHNFVKPHDRAARYEGERWVD